MWKRQSCAMRDVSTTMIIQPGPVVDFLINNQNVKDPYDSLEKLRPEKEIECAKSDINRYKLKIKDLFKQTNTSLEEGKFPESLYDSDRLIDSEDIFFLTRAQTDVWLDNDIILRDVPPGDEGWLCPACDYKMECVDLINETQGTDLSVNDSWEISRVTYIYYRDSQFPTASSNVQVFSS
nr:homeobox protein HAT3.1 [Tanacetum cinerariifolium]